MKKHMTQKFSASQLIVGLTVFSSIAMFTACRHSEHSEAKFDSNVGDALNSLQLKTDQLKKICSINTLIVFAGNAEMMAHPAKFNADNKAAQDKYNQERAEQNSPVQASFRKSVIDAKTAIHARIVNQNYTICEGHGTGATDLLSVYDGDGRGDSQISWYRKNEGYKENKFIYRDGKVQKQEDEVKFELNMAKDLESIFLHFRNEGKYEQVSYYLKTHGGVFKAPNGKPGHVLFFDINGPKGALTSSLWHPVHSSEYVDAVCAAGKPSAKSKWCRAKRSRARFAKIQGLVPEDDTGGLNPTDDTGGLNPTDDTGGFSDSDDTGGFSDSDDTGGFSDSDDTGGKGGLLFGNPDEAIENGKIKPFDGKTFVAKPNFENPGSHPEGFRRLGAAAHYGLDIADEAQFKPEDNLFLLKLRVGLKKGAELEPVQVVFDSCHMSNRLKGSAFAKLFNGRKISESQNAYALTAGKPDQVTILTLSNSNPLYIFAMDYQVPNGFQYKALPYIFLWGNGDKGNLSTSEVRATASGLSRFLSKGLQNQNRIIENRSYQKDMKKKHTIYTNMTQVQAESTQAPVR